MTHLIDIHRTVDAIIIKPGKDLTGTMIDLVRNDIEALLAEKPEKLILDAADIGLIGSLGVGLLIDLAKIDCEFRVINAKKELYDMLMSMNLDRHLTIECRADEVDGRAEQRNRLRMDFVTEVILTPRAGQPLLAVELRNISMSGVYVAGSQKLPVDADCTIEIVLTAPTSTLTLKTEGRVNRIDEDGMGLAFHNDIEWFSLFSIFAHYGKPHNR